MSLSESCSINLNNLEVVGDWDVANSDQYTYVDRDGDLYVYKNKINGNLTYFKNRLIDIHNPKDKFFIRH
ncbi:hypothetical protein CaLGV117 [Clostera anastomosis granulovirus A]|uniref:Uncharacterized protein n=1 Tax=Clostera anastomosis granulovirus A TaxID=1986289 RepID=U5KBB5_9BBAC|nr:hypothetical protein CaLGV117 [Clostera anastomosis granulovirus Henan]AGQ20375.1 hypothetical protein CaLGV117 [Clostera anastomosis granulovirus Henan]